MSEASAPFSGFTRQPSVSVTLSGSFNAVMPSTTDSTIPLETSEKDIENMYNFCEKKLNLTFSLHVSIDIFESFTVFSNFHCSNNMFTDYTE